MDKDQRKIVTVPATVGAMAYARACQQQKPEEPKKIRFINHMTYDTIFTVPDGGRIKITRGDGSTEIWPIHYVSDIEFETAGSVYDIHDFARISFNRAYKVEPVLEPVDEMELDEEYQANLAVAQIIKNAFLATQYDVALEADIKPAVRVVVHGETFAHTIDVRVFLRMDDDASDEQRCRVCGCTEDHACPGGCYWVEEDLCSACAGKPEAAPGFTITGAVLAGETRDRYSEEIAIRTALRLTRCPNMGTRKRGHEIRICSPTIGGVVTGHYAYCTDCDLRTAEWPTKRGALQAWQAGDFIHDEVGEPASNGEIITGKGNDNT